MGHETCCCCHIISAAALVGVLQLLLLVIGISNSGLILDRWTDGEYYDINAQLREKVDSILDRIDSSTTAAAVTANTTKMPTTTPESRAWREALLEIHLANSIAVSAVWLLALAAYAGAFRYYSPVFVLPNYVMQVVGILGTIGVINGLSVRIADPKDGLDEEDDETSRVVILSFFLASAVVTLILEIVFVVIIHKFYKFLYGLSGSLLPDRAPNATQPAFH